LSNSPLPDSTDLSALLHELNQPLTSILSNAQAGQRFLSNTLLDRAELHDILQDIIADDKRAAAIIKRLSQALKDADSPAENTAENTASADEEEGASQ
jgi:signal transduction histidine kinase